jgi:hypothetical protein
MKSGDTFKKAEAYTSDNIFEDLTVQLAARVFVLGCTQIVLTEAGLISRRSKSAFYVAGVIVSTGYIVSFSKLEDRQRIFVFWAAMMRRL